MHQSTWPDDEPQERRLAEGHAMKDTATVPRNPADREPALPPVVDPELADQLLARAEAGGEAGSGVHGQQPGELERGDASQALPEQRTVRCPLAGIAGRPAA